MTTPERGADSPSCPTGHVPAVVRPPPEREAGTLLTLRLDSRLESGREASRVVGGLCREAGFDAATCYAVELCTAEAVVNAVRHGYEERAGNVVEVIADLSEGAIVVSVADDGPGLTSGWPPPSCEHLDQAALEERAGGGWGLLMMHRLMDRVELLPTVRGTKLRLVKHLRRLPSTRKEQP